jgi:hypothetical protein
MSEVLILAWRFLKRRVPRSRVLQYGINIYNKIIGSIIPSTMPPRQKTSERYERHYIQHNYHDHSQDTPSSKEEYAFEAFSGTRTLGQTRSSAVRFPFRLHNLLENAEANGHSSLISWKVHGRAFSVNNLKGFSEEVMPQYFNQTKTKSFFRQLNLYGFLRITQGHDKGAYYHELFLRGKPFLASKIMRQKVKGTMVKGLPSPETEPDFYSMPYVMCTLPFPSLTISVSRTAGPGELALPIISSSLPTPVPNLFNFHGDNEQNSASVNHSEHPKIDSYEDETSIVHQTQINMLLFLNDKSDLDVCTSYSSAHQKTASDISFLNGEDINTLLQCIEEPIDDKCAMIDLDDENRLATDDFSIYDDHSDHLGQKFSAQECIVLRFLLEDTAE